MRRSCGVHFGATAFVPWLIAGLLAVPFGAILLNAAGLDRADRLGSWHPDDGVFLGVRVEVDQDTRR